MKEYIAKAVDGKNLTQEEAKKAMEIMLSGEATQAQIAAFLTAMLHERRNVRGTHRSGIGAAR